MMVRLAFILIFAALISTLSICGFASFRSKKPIGKSVSIFCLSLIPPVLGNMIITAATTKDVALVGCYTYYVGMDLIMLALIKFTNEYCGIRNHKSTAYKTPVWVYCALVTDVVQMLLNPIFGHAFYVEEIEVYGSPYFIMTPLLGQTFHRIVCYGVMAMIIMVFLIRSIRVPRLYRERYVVIFISMIIGTIWQTFYIFSQTPIDRSMVGFGVFGLLIFYFSMYYRPVRLLDSMLAQIVSHTQESVFLYGPEGRCIWVNEQGIELTGIAREDFDSADDVLSGIFPDNGSLPENTENEYSVGTGENEKIYTVARGSFYDSNDRKLGAFLRVRDITEEKKRMERQFFEANHDALTGVYNKEYTFKKISDKLKQHALKDYYIASIYICDFKMFNDVFGRDFGDSALIQVADWLRKYSDDNCIFGRIAGDAFCSCLPKDLFFEDIVEKDLEDFKVRAGSTEYHLVIHVGMCEIEDSDRDVSVLFDRASLALDSIRDDYNRHVAFFDKKIRDRMIWNQEISAQLDIATKQNQIRPFLQPIADRSGKIVGAEALARWIHPMHGFLNPGEFIPLFEENGMIVELDKHIWKSACYILASWKDKYPNLFISVNVSPKDFYMTDVFEDIKGLVEEYDINPHNLRVEVTESSMMRETEEKMKVLDEFRNHGFIVEMDDFGSGYSSLNMLKDMPVDVLKIDMKFLGKASDEAKANIIVKNVIKLSEDLGITSLTEGVETIEHFNMLYDLGCILFQGYYFSKPLPLEEFEDMLEKNR